MSCKKSSRSSPEKTIAVLPGDGIGPEVIRAALAVLNVIAELFQQRFQTTEALIGGAALEATGVPLPEETLQACQRADAILLGAVGGPQWDALPLQQRPETGLLQLRKKLELYANLRPIRPLPGLQDVCPLKEQVIRDVDLVIVRELTGGIYYGPRWTSTEDGFEAALDAEFYTACQVERIARLAFSLARARKKKVTSVDKANVLASSQLWRRTVERTWKYFPDVSLAHMYVDNCALQLVRNPRQFDIILTSNLFGDILSDAAASLEGSLGMLPSLCRGNRAILVEPVHGAAPDLAGKDQASPLGAIRCIGIMLREAFGLREEAALLEEAIASTLHRGYRTVDIASTQSVVVGTAKMAELICQEIRRHQKNAAHS